MRVLYVITEIGKQSLSKPFTYLYDGHDQVDVRYRVMVPFGPREIMGFVTRVVETNKTKKELEEETGMPLRYISRVIDREPLLDDELMKLATAVADYYMAPLISVLQAMLPKSLAPRRGALKGPKEAYEKWVRLLKDEEKGLTPKQVECVRLLKRSGEVLKKEASTPTVVRALLDKGILEQFDKPRSRYVIPEAEREMAHEPTLDQRNAIEEILSSSHSIVLLQGVTGSGKTEVYLRLSEHYLQEGKNVLMLVPEISLTPVMVEYFSRRFGRVIAILHSGLTPAEKYDEYQRIKRGEARIVVGARSAIFAPLENIGLIVIDEEHVDSYKQSTAPFYHARETAIMRSKINGAKVVLGSATPSLETKARAMRGIYGYASLPRRISDQGLPTTTIVDMRSQDSKGSVKHIFSKQLIEKIGEKIGKQEQVILLLNRRGYSSYITCEKCGYVFECPNCGSPLTYHYEDQMLKCHHCDFILDFPKVCPQCGSSSLARVGFGTERVMKEIADLFPSARAARLDSDAGKVAKNVASLTKAFKNHEYDILVGTEMIAKGHDFPLVTLVGDVLADIGLNLSTYRASERTFNLIAQAVGRSGRAKRKGEALIQTYSPSHYAIVYGAKQDYEAFFRREMMARKTFGYPPYYFLIEVRFLADKEEKAAKAAADFKRVALLQGFKDLEIVGPGTPFLSFFQGKYRRTLLFKYKDGALLRRFLRQEVERISGKGGVEAEIEVDPLDS